MDELQFIAGIAMLTFGTLWLWMMFRFFLKIEKRRERVKNHLGGLAEYLLKYLERLKVEHDRRKKGKDATSS